MARGWRFGLGTALVALAAGTGEAAVSLPSVLGEHMVVQRDRPLHLWGQAAPGESVTASFRGESRTAAADELGRWSLFLPPSGAGGPFTLAILLRDVMAWLVVLCGELGLDGLMFTPAGYFVATFGSRFLDPIRQARLEAMRRALSSLRLVEATRAVEEGRVLNAGTGAVVPWEPALMVIPVSPRLRDRVEGAEYGAALEAEHAALSYRLREQGELEPGR